MPSGNSSSSLECITLVINSSIEMREFSEEELNSVTNGYQNKVSKRTFGAVFRGTVQHVSIAVKVVDPVRFLFNQFTPPQLCLTCSFKVLLTTTSRSTFAPEIQAL